MFDLDNIDLDFDEDLSSNIFSKRTSSLRRTAAERDKVCSGGAASDALKQQTDGGSRPESRTFLGGLPKSPLTSGARDNQVKRPHAEDERPQRKRVSPEGLLQRKFPGPAGLLPDKRLQDLGALPLEVERPLDEEEESLEEAKPVVYSQCSGSVFLEPGYQKLVSEFNLKCSENPLNRYTVEWVKKKALSKGLQGRKIPFLGLVVHVVSHSMPDPVLVLRDPTGEISGSLHREVWAELGGKLRSGIALALRQVGVLTTGVIRRQIYLNITMNNILTIYSPSENEGEVQVTTVNRASRSELVRSFAEWVQPSRTAPAHPLPPSPFTTLDSHRPPDNPDGTFHLLPDWGIALHDSHFQETHPPTASAPAPAQPLSPAEASIVQDVLSGITLDDFEP